MVHVASTTCLPIIFVGTGTDLVRNCSAEENPHSAKACERDFDWFLLKMTKKGIILTFRLVDVFKRGPPFLDKLSPEAKDEFNTTMRNMTVPQRVVVEETKNWAKQQGTEIEAAMNELMIENYTALSVEAEEVIEKLPVSSKVREVLHKIVARWHPDENSSIDEQTGQVEQITDNHSDEISVKMEEELTKLKALIPSFQILYGG